MMQHVNLAESMMWIKFHKRSSTKAPKQNYFSNPSKGQARHKDVGLQIHDSPYRVNNSQDVFSFEKDYLV